MSMTLAAILKTDGPAEDSDCLLAKISSQRKPIFFTVVAMTRLLNIAGVAAFPQKLRRKF